MNDPSERLRAAIDRLNETLESRSPEPPTPSSPERVLSLEEQAAMRHRIFSDPTSPFRRAQEAKRRYLNPEDQ